MLSSATVSSEQWDDFVRGRERGHALQLSGYGELKRAFGWEVERITITDERGEIVAGGQLLFRPLPLSKMAYLPMGPYYDTREQAIYFWKLVDRCIINRRRSAFLKWEPGIISDEPDFKGLGFRPAEQTIQPPNTILINLRGDDDKIMARMNQGTRRKIRKSFKSNIHYYEATREDVYKFTDMMQVTGDRNEFGVHEPRYYELAYDLFVPQGDAALILAEHEGDVLAGVMVFKVNRTAWYLYGASSNIKRNLMAAYGVQWEAIQWAKARKCHTYDMWGIPDEHPVLLEEHFADRSDGLWGVYGFKRGWGGEVVRSVGAWDKVYNALIYRGYLTALKLRGG